MYRSHLWMPNVRITKIKMGSLAKYMAAVAVKMHAAASCGHLWRQHLSFPSTQRAGTVSYSCYECYPDMLRPQLMILLPAEFISGHFRTREPSAACPGQDIDGKG